MNKLFTILFFLCGSTLATSAQTIPSALQRSLQQKIRNGKDSLSAPTHSYIKQGNSMGPTKTNKGKDTLASIPVSSRKLAVTDTVQERVIMLPSLDHGSCKSIIFIPQPQTFEKVKVPKEHPQSPAPAEPQKKPPFLQVHGNIMYNVNYYSRIDTPYNERDVYQHTIQTYLDVLLKGQYPFRIFLTNRFSNSSLFRNFSDFNFSYNNTRFAQQIKDQVRQAFLQSLPSQKILDSLKNLLNSDLYKLRGLNTGIKNPALIQKMIEARERTMGKGQPKTDSIASIDLELAEADSLLAIKEKIKDSISREIGNLLQLLKSANVKSQLEINQTLQDIERAGNPGQLQKKMKSLGIGDSALPKGYKTLMAIKSFNLGRTVVNYSELSAKNISINGVQAEYNPSLYYAVASGSIDYRFRDFIVQSPRQSHQYLNVLRMGKGLKDGNSMILTYFSGRRQLYNAATSDTSAYNVQKPSASLIGLTLEGNYHINDHILLTGELAKSSTPSYTGDTSSKSHLSSQLFQMNDRSNEAWALKVNAFFPRTQTRVKGAYKHLGVNYQSFSLFTDGSSQTAWSASVNQLFFRKQLEVMLGANTNDFSNPFISQEYKSTTVFKTLQATLRRRNWPVISLGYFPSSQITKLGDHQYIENLFYTLVGNMTHSYRYHNTMMNSAVVYTQFYNRSSDSGFTYFNTRNLLLSQSVFLDKFTLQFNASGATNQDYQLYTLEGKVQHSLSQVLTLGAGIKYNKQTAYNIEQLGYSAEATLRLDRLGQIQFSADKGFIPGMNKQLVPDNTGRLTYFKTF